MEIIFLKSKLSLEYFEEDDFYEKPDAAMRSGYFKLNLEHRIGYSD